MNKETCQLDDTPEQLASNYGTGSGILAIWSAQAGARKVYAVEATKMADHARELVKANNLADVVEVIEGTVEDISLPEKVDIIISEWMGYFLLRESMLDSVICARDRWLKPTGAMYPSHARMWVAPIRSGLGEQKKGDYESSVDDWYKFLDETKTYYGVNMDILSKPYCAEQKRYYLETSIWNLVGEILEWVRTQHWWDFNEMDYMMLITAYGKQGDFNRAERLLGYMNKLGYPLSVISVTALMEAYGRGGQYNKAEAVFRRMQSLGPEPSAVTYQIILKLFVEAGMVLEAAF